MRSFRVTLCVLSSVLMAIGLAEGQQIYWVQATYGGPTIRTCDTSGNALKTVSLPPGSLPHGLALHVPTSTLYWASGRYTAARLGVTAQSFSTTDTLLHGATGSSYQGVAVDTVAGTVYWTTSKIDSGCSVRRANLDGTGEHVVVPYGVLGIPNLRGIALDLQHQKMYWVDFGSGLIMTANLNGSNPITLLSGVTGPVGIALDVSGGKMYWCEANGHMIRRANLDGSSPATIVSGLATPQYLALDPKSKKIFWTELGGNGRGWIKRANLDGSNVVTILGNQAADSVQYPAGIAVLGSTTTTGVEEARRPTAFSLSQNYPNPFNPATTITYELPVSVHVTLGVYDILGRQVAWLVDEAKDAGIHRVTFDATGLASGVYLYRLQAGTFTEARGLVVTK